MAARAESREDRLLVLERGVVLLPREEHDRVAASERRRHAEARRVGRGEGRRDARQKREERAVRNVRDEPERAERGLAGSANPAAGTSEPGELVRARETRR